MSEMMQLFLTVCGAIITVSGAGAAVIAVIKAMRKPDTERDEKLKRHDEMLDNDNRQIKELKESNNIIMHSLLALMSHELDGNHTDDLLKARDDLQSYLIRR